MKTEPHIGDLVWIYIYDKIWKCEIKEQVPMWSDGDKDIGLCYKLKPIGETCPGREDGFVIQRKYFFPTAREAIKVEIKHKNELIRENKAALEIARSTIKSLKQKRAELQRMLEFYH